MTQRKSVDAVRGGAVTALERVISQACQLAVFVVAARVLGPAEFGLFALVSACAILLMRAAEGGWAAYIMAWSGDGSVPGQVLFVALLSALGAGALGLGIGAALPALGLAWSTAELVMLFALWLALAVMSSAQKGVLIWQKRLTAAALVEIAAELVGLAVALGALFAGAGVFALVFGRLAFQSVHLAAMVALTRVYPRAGIAGQPLRDLLAMSAQLFTVRMIYHLRLYAATFVVGAFLGPAAVGFYRAGERLVSALGEVVSVPAHTLGWGLFREARDAGGGGTARFQQTAGVFFPTMIALTAPVFLWVAIMAEDIVLGLLGEDWLPALPVIAILAAARLLLMPGAVTEPILTVAGEIRRLPRISVLYLVATLALVLVAAPFGLVPLAVSQLAMAGLIAATTMWLLRRYAAIDWRGFAPRMLRLVPPLAVGAGILLGLRESAALAEWPPLLRAVAVVPPACLGYAVALWLAVPDLRPVLRARLRRPPAAENGA